MNTPTLTRADFVRISKSYRKLREFMRDGKRHTLREMAAAAGCSETSVSARWRELQYPCAADGFPGYEQHKLPNAVTGVWVYWVTVKAAEQMKLELTA